MAGMESEMTNERELIVAWLRTANDDDEMDEGEKALVNAIADGIEQGAHLPQDVPTPEEMEAVLKQMAADGLVTEGEPGQFSITEWGGARARHLLRTSPEAQQMWASLEANRDKIKEALAKEPPAP